MLNALVAFKATQEENMLNFFRKRKLKLERERLYKDILSFVRENYQYKQIVKYSLPKSPPSAPKEEPKGSGIPKWIEEEYQNAARPSAPSVVVIDEDSGIKFSMKDPVCEPTETPEVVIVNGELTLHEGSPNMPTFSNEVKRLMSERSMTGSDLCKRILMDRRLWSKLNTDVEYQPSRETATAICIALHLNVAQAEELLQSAGFTLSATRKQDVVMRYFLQNNIYDIDVINDMLYRFGFKCIGTNIRE